MLKTLIVDDEPDAIKSLNLICTEYCKDKVKIVGTAQMIDAAHKLIENQSPDLILLDIDLPCGNGFDLLDRFPNRDFQVILVSAYFDKYKKRMRKHDIYACVDKPVDIDEISDLMRMLYQQKTTS